MKHSICRYKVEKEIKLFMDWYYTLIQCLGLFWTSHSNLQQKRDGRATFRWLNLLASLVPWLNWFNIFEQSLGLFLQK